MIAAEGVEFRKQDVFKFPANEEARKKYINGARTWDDLDNKTFDQGGRVGGEYFLWKGYLLERPGMRQGLRAALTISSLVSIIFISYSKRFALMYPRPSAPGCRYVG